MAMVINRYITCMMWVIAGRKKKAIILEDKEQELIGWDSLLNLFWVLMFHQTLKEEIWRAVCEL